MEIILILVCRVVISCIFIYGIYRSYMVYRINKKGTKAYGEIIDMKVRSFLEGGADARVTIRFRVDEKYYQFSTIFPTDDIGHYKIGDTVNILYEEENPKNAMDDMHSRGGGPYIFCAIIFLVLLHIIKSILLSA